MNIDQFSHLVKPKYLGYGVYIGVDPELQEYVLWTERDAATHYINLTGEEIEALIRYTGRDA